MRYEQEVARAVVHGIEEAVQVPHVQNLVPLGEVHIAAYEVVPLPLCAIWVGGGGGGVGGLQ